MPASPAQMRATWMKLAISQAKRMPDAERAQRAIRPTLRETIRAASIVEWLPAALFAELTEAFVTSMGDAGARALWRDALLRGFDRPLMRPLVEGALTIYGRSPASIMKMSPRAWALVARDAGTVSVEPLSERAHRTLFRNVPPEFRAGTGFLTVLLGNGDAVLRRFGANGTVRADDSRLVTSGEVALDVTWSTASIPPPAAP